MTMYFLGHVTAMPDPSLLIRNPAFHLSTVSEITEMFCFYIKNKNMRERGEERGGEGRGGGRWGGGKEGANEG